MSKQSVVNIARKDIKESIHLMYNYKPSTYYPSGKGAGVIKENWNVTSKHLFTKESYLLNRKLGLHSINKFGAKMAR